MTHKSEDRIQQECFMWFNNAYPELRGCLFAVPNGGARSSREGKLLKLTGTWSGVSDMLLMVNGVTTCFELKTEIGTQSINQIKWQNQITRNGFQYFIIRDLNLFKQVVNQIINRS